MKKIIKQYLDSMASEDSVFAAKYNSKDKDIDGCLAYIREQAKALPREGNCVAVEDKVVYGWAIHYFDEDVKAVKANTVEKKANPPQLGVKGIAEYEKKKEAAKQPKIKAKKEEDNSDLLFNLDEL